MFQFENIPMEVADEDGMKKFTIHPDDLYPAVIARIHDVLAGKAEPVELRDSKYLVTMARGVPATAWGDALLPRDQFIDVPFAAFVQDGKPNEMLLRMVHPDRKAEVERMVQRGLALEVARKWFTRSLGHEYGQCNLHITTGKNDDKAFRL